MNPLDQASYDRVAQALSECDIDGLKTSMELHQFAWNYNWDDGFESLFKVIRSPLCDRGTALLVYWSSAPRWFYKYENREQVKKSDLQGYDLVKEIEEKYLLGFYKKQYIRFDPTNDLGDDWTQRYKDVEVYRDIPIEMVKPSPGVAVSREIF